MRQKPNPEIAKRIQNRKIELVVKKMARDGKTPESIAKETGQSIEWIKLTLEDYDPRSHTAELERAKEKQRKSMAQSSKSIGRPTRIEREEKQKNEKPLTVEEVLASYKQIRADIKSGKWKSAKEASEDLGLEYDLVFRLGKGYWSNNS
jgi:hypothetical protein